MSLPHRMTPCAWWASLILRPFLADQMIKLEAGKTWEQGGNGVPGLQILQATKVAVDVSGKVSRMEG